MRSWSSNILIRTTKSCSFKVDWLAVCYQATCINPVSAADTKGLRNDIWERSTQVKDPYQKYDFIKTPCACSYAWDMR